MGSRERQRIKEATWAVLGLSKEFGGSPQHPVKIPKEMHKTVLSNTRILIKCSSLPEMIFCAYI